MINVIKQLFQCELFTYFKWNALGAGIQLIQSVLWHVLTEGSMLGKELMGNSYLQFLEIAITT